MTLTLEFLEFVRMKTERSFLQEFLLPSIVMCRNLEPDTYKKLEFALSATKDNLLYAPLFNPEDPETAAYGLDEQDRKVYAFFWHDPQDPENAEKAFAIYGVQDGDAIKITELRYGPRASAAGFYKTESDGVSTLRALFFGYSQSLGGAFCRSRDPSGMTEDDKSLSFNSLGRYIFGKQDLLQFKQALANAISVHSERSGLKAKIANPAIS